MSKLLVEKNLPKLMLTNTGTCEYKAPEMHEGGAYTEAVDLWAAGVTFFEMVEKRRPFSHNYLKDTIRSICSYVYKEGAAWEQHSGHARNLMRRLLKPASKRLTASEALQAFWF